MEISARATTAILFPPGLPVPNGLPATQSGATFPGIITALHPARRFL
jgi:hypothetical protein